MASVPKNIYDLVKNEEGFSNKVYSDASGYSVGHGHFLSDDELKLYPPGTTVPQAQLDKWYEEDLDKSYRAAQTQANSLPRFQELDPTQRQAFLERLTSVNFQLGTAWNTKFVDTWKLMQDGDFEAASKEAMDSKWAREQTPTRAAKFSSLLGSLGNSTGQIPGGFTPGQENRGANPLFDLVAPTTRSRTRPSRARDRTTYTPTTGPVSVGQPIPAGQPAYNQFDQGMVGSASRLDLSGVLAAKLNETVKYEAAASAARQYRGDTSTTPRYTTGDIWSDSVKAGGEQLTSDVYQFGAIFNLLQGDEEAATAKLNRAERLQQDASLLLNSMGTFEDFLEEPTFEGFFDQVVKSIGQFTPMAISSVGSGFTGAAVAAVGKGVLSATSKRVTREVISDILKKKVAHRKGLGEALDEAEEAILAGAYESVKRMGQYPNFVNLARTGSVPSNFPFISAGFWAGAGGQEYVVGSSQALGEYKEAGYKLTDEEAAAALGLGIPQAIIGTLGEKLFVGALFKRMAGRYAKTGDPEAAGWLMEAAKGFGGGLLKGGLVEGTTEALQEELFIQQRFGIDPNYSDREANLRRAESAFAGFWAGAGRSAPTGAIANVIGKARSYTEEGMDITEEAVIASKRGQSDGRVIPEPKEWSQAQIQALLDEETETKAVWLPTDGLNEADTANTLNDFLQDLVEEGYTPAQIEEKFAMVQDTANNSGFLILDKTNKNFQTDANDAVDSGFSETFLQQILGYTEVSDPSHNAVVQVKDSAGNVVWQQTTSEANVDKVKLHARTRFKNESKYSIEGVTREAAFNERQQAFRGEGFGFTQTQETAPETRTPEAPEGPAPEQGEFDFTERSMETTGQQIDPTLRELGTIKSPTDPATTITQEEADKFSKAGDVIEGGREGFITKPLTKAEQAKMTEQEIVQARANRPIMTWAPRDPATAFEGMTDEEVNAELDKREGLEQDFLDLNGIEENPEVRALLDTLPTSFLETFKAQSRIDPNRMLTPRQNENGEWTMATSPKDVLPGDRINAAERIGDVVTQASRASQALRNKTPGWSVRSPDGRVRDVYMGNLVQFGIDLGLNAPEGYTQGTGRIADGFTRMYEALVENGYELLYQGTPINEAAPAAEAAPAQPSDKALFQQGEFSDLSARFDEFAQVIRENKLTKRTAGREVIWFGAVDYEYTGARHQAQDMPDEFSDLARRLEARLNYPEGYFNSVLTNLYPRGKGIGAHADDEVVFLRRNKTIGAVATINLGGASEVTIINKQTRQKVTRTVSDGDLYVMPDGTFQAENLHAVGPANAPRISMTFRHVPSSVLEQQGIQPTQQQEAGPPLNIWAGTNENAELSNLAIRPFEDTQGRQYQSVEHAYQSWKSGQFDETVYNNPRWGEGPVKIIGRKGTKTEDNWNVQLMDRLMRLSFEQNPEAQQALINTGNAVLTHTQDRGVWRTKFPEILMGLRTEFQGKVAQEATPTKLPRAKVQAAAWQNAPIYQVKGGETVSFVQAEQGRLITDQEIKVGEKETTTDAARRRELEALDNKVQRAFEEFYADPNRDPKDKFYPPDALSQQESDRKFQLERELNEGFVDRADFVDEIKGTEGEFAPPKVDLDNPLHAPIVTLTEIRTGGSMNDPLGPPRVYPNKGRVQIDASWSSVMGKVWPQLQNILTSRLGYGGRNTEILTKQHIVENGYETDARVMQDGQEYSIAELINESVANMDSLGKYFRFKDTDLIIIDVPANPTVNQQVKSILALGHEIGHAMFHQEMERALNNPKLRNDLIAAWEKDRDAGVSEQYKGEFGFEEWYADQMGTWLLAEAKKPTNGVESFFKRLADKIRAVFRSLDGNLRRRFTQNEAFDPYVQDVIKTYKDGNIRNTNMPVSDKVIVRNMLDELGARIKPFMPRKALQQIKRIAIENLEAGKELMPNDKRHWSVAYFLQPAHNYLKKFSPELANAIYSMSQSEEKTGHLNARILLTYQRLNDLHKIAPTKQTITGKTVPDLDAFETILREAERDVPKEQLSPKAQEVRQFLDDFYENYIRGKDDVFKRANFYPRIIAIAELQANPELRTKLVELLEQYNPEGPEDIVQINPNTGQEMSRAPGSFEKVVEAMIREGEDNTDNSRPEVADVAIGTNEARAQYFRNIPNEALRNIGALEDANTAVRRYISDMTKRLDYKEKFQTTLTKQDIANIKAQGPAFRQSFKGKKARDVVDGWQATEIMLQRIPNETDRAAARDAMKAMLGKTGLNMSPAMRSINSVLLSVNIMTYLTFATLASLPDLAGPVLRSKDLSMENLKEGLNQVRRYFTDTKEMQQFARDVGVITFDSLNTSIMQANEMGFMTPTAQKYSDLFFKAIGLEWYTNFTRTFAAGMGEQFLIRQANLNTDRSSRNLRELQVSREDIKVWDQNGRSFSTPEGQRVQMALGRFVEESIVRPNSAERPVWASNPYTALVWQLKSFFYAYGKNVVGGAIRESKNRYSEDGTVSSASVPLVLGALTILPLTMVGLEIREWLKYLGRGGDERAFRSDTMRWGEYSEDIIDRAGILGPFGLIIPILEADQFGKSFWVPPLGPTAERLEDLIRGNAKLSDYMPGYAAVR